MIEKKLEGNLLIATRAWEVGNVNQAWFLLAVCAVHALISIAEYCWDWRAANDNAIPKEMRP